MVSLFQERELELAYLQFIIVEKPLLLDALAVDVGAVEAIEILHPEAAFIAQNAGVMPRHCDIVQEEVAMGATPYGEDVEVEGDGLALVRQADDDAALLLRRMGRNPGALASAANGATDTEPTCAPFLKKSLAALVTSSSL